MSAQITVSLKDVLMGGTFGPIYIGMARARVHETLGDPDDWSAADAARRGPDPWRTSTIWKYGDLEFYFGLVNDECLAQIYMDDFTVPQGGPSIALDPWIIRREIPQSEVEQALRAAHIEFRRFSDRFDEHMMGLTVGTRVRLHFARPTPEEDPFLFALSCADPRLPSADQP